MNASKTKNTFVLFISIFCISFNKANASEITSPLQFYNEQTQTYDYAPGIASDIHISIEGTIGRTNVTQYFMNNTDSWQEGIYRYPLPDNAAVDSLTMMIGEKRIIGFVHEKEEAIKIYNAAKKEGKAAGLVEQHRPNIFKNSVANIPPQTIIAIEIQYQYPVDLDDYVFSMRMPMAITPRFDIMPLEDLMTLTSANNQEWTKPVLDRIALTDFEGGYNPVALSIDINPGFEIDNIKSRSHKININEEDGIYSIKTEQKILPGEQDFTLSWEPVMKNESIISSHQEELDGDIYTHLLIMPPKDIKMLKNLPQPQRQVTYILDTSGSMDGPSIKQARKALITALQDLNEDDFFNIIEFNSTHRKLFNQPQQAIAQNIQKAIQRVGELEADGGTVMIPAIEEAFAEDIIPSHLRQIVFITDGAIGYESEMTKLIKNKAGDARFFAIGIGAAPNAHLMNSIASAGRGTSSFIGDIRDIEEQLSSLFTKMKTPALTDLELIMPDGIHAEVIPSKLPDLMAGEPVSIAIKSDKELGRIDLQGQRGGKDWHMNKKIKDHHNAKGISKLYARRKIQDIQLNAEADQFDQTKQAIIDLGIKHQIMSQYTSFVAVDEDIIRPENAKLNTKTYDPSLPNAWQEGRTEARDASRLYQELLHKNSADENNIKHDINLPQTATGYELMLLLGMLMMAISTAAFILRRYLLSLVGKHYA